MVKYTHTCFCNPSELSLTSFFNTDLKAVAVLAGQKQLIPNTEELSAPDPAPRRLREGRLHQHPCCGLSVTCQKRHKLATLFISQRSNPEPLAIS